MSKPMKTMALTFTRVVDAAPRAVYDAWLDTKTPGAGGPWQQAERAVLDKKVDGLFYFAMGKEDGSGVAHYGRFLKLQRGRLARFTWMSKYTRGLESVVSFSLKAKGNRTVVSLRHDGLPDDSFGRAHKAWDDLLDELVGRFAPARPAGKRPAR